MERWPEEEISMCPKCSSSRIKKIEGFLEDEMICVSCGHLYTGVGTGIKVTGGGVLGVAALVFGMIFSADVPYSPMDG